MNHNFEVIAPQIKLNVTNDDLILTARSSQSLRWIRSNSAEESKDALESIARCFKNEMRFDNLQYDANDHYDDSCIGFIIVQLNLNCMKDYDFEIAEQNIQIHYVIGGGCFRDKFDKSKKLDFVWLHPYARQRGIMKKAWEKFNSKFGDFDLEKPISSSMMRFLDKNKKTLKTR